MDLASVIGIIVVAGISGGLVNWTLTRSDGPDPRPWWSHVISGIAASFLVPLFLHLASSDLLKNLLDPNQSASSGLSSLIFAGFCLAAAISSKSFIDSVSHRVMQMAKEAKKVSEEAKDESEKAITKADAAAFTSQAAHDQAAYLTPTTPTAALQPSAVTKGKQQDDPWAGQFGGSPKSNGRVLEAQFRPIPDMPGGWVATRLTVKSTDLSRPLTDPVQFYLHDTFPNPTPTVPLGPDKAATLTIMGWGAFTVGALADGGKTKLELDLSAHPDAPEPFRSR